MTRYRTEMDVNGQRHTTYRDADDASDAAWQAVRAWRSDAKFREAMHGHDLYGIFTKYSFGGPRMMDIAVVRVYLLAEE